MQHALVPVFLAGTLCSDADPFCPRCLCCCVHWRNYGQMQSWQMHKQLALLKLFGQGEHFAYAPMAGLVMLKAHNCVFHPQCRHIVRVVALDYAIADILSNAVWNTISNHGCTYLHSESDAYDYWLVPDVTPRSCDRTQDACTVALPCFTQQTGGGQDM